MTSSPALNPAITDWNGPDGLPRFEAVSDSDFAASFEAALAEHETEIDAIANNPQPATFENTIVTLETAGEALSRVSSLFWNRAGAHTNDAIQALERDISPKMSRHYSKIGMNATLFRGSISSGRSARLLASRSSRLRVLERHWKGFVKSGAKLPKPEQETLAGINEKLAGLSTQFGQNVLADEKGWSLILSDGPELEGLPDFLKDAMASAARERGEDGNMRSHCRARSSSPFLTFSERRDLREQAFKAWVARGENPGETDNRGIIRETLALRSNGQAARLRQFRRNEARQHHGKDARCGERSAARGLGKSHQARPRGRSRYRKHDRRGWQEP
jgi:peptidyl-dipeptidase Dcp